MNTQHIEAIPHRPDADTFDLHRSLELLRHAILGHMLLIIATTTLTVGLVVAFIAIWPKTYAAEVMVMAEAEDDRSRERFYADWNVFRRNNLPDEAVLINARDVLEETAARLDLTYYDVYHPFLRYLTHLWGESLVGKSYRKVKYAIFGRPCEPNCMTKEEELHEKMLRDFKEGVTLAPVADSYVGSVFVLASNPRAAEMANTLVEVFLEKRKQRYIDEARGAVESLEAETERARQELLAAEDAMEAYYQEQNMLLDFEKDKVEITNWLTLKSEITQTEAILASMEESHEALEQLLQQEQKEIIGGRTTALNAEMETMESQYLSLELALNQARIRYTPESPEVTEIEQQLAAVEQMMLDEESMEETQVTEILNEVYQVLRQRSNELVSQIAGTRAGLEVKIAAEAELREKVELIPNKLSTTHAMGREHSMMEDTYVALQNKLTMAKVSLATVTSAPPSMKLISRAIPPQKASFPNTKLFLAAALAVGVILGALLGLALDLLRQRVNRYYLNNDRVGDSLYARVPRDADFLERVFALQASNKKRLLIQLGR